MLRVAALACESAGGGPYVVRVGYCGYAATSPRERFRSASPPPRLLYQHGGGISKLFPMLVCCVGVGRFGGTIVVVGAPHMGLRCFCGTA